ncbi:MAG: phosphoglycerate kinase [Halobacteriota archaeon]
MIKGLPTLDDVECGGKSVLVRLDVNSPIVNSTILDTNRFESHLPTLDELEDAKVVLTSHQSRPGKKDFTTLESHAKVLSRIAGKNISYLDEMFSKRAIDKINNLENGDVLFLENVRLYSEERMDRSPESHAESIMISKLKDYFDLFVNDAFAACHRNNASLVGFVPVIPSVGGRLIEKEVEALSTALHSKDSKIFILGGAKIKDSVKVMENVLTQNIAEKVVLTGVTAIYFHMLDGQDIGNNKEVVAENKEDVDDKKMKKLLKDYRDRVMLPIDYGVEVDGVRNDVPIEELQGKIMDIGINTISALSEVIPQYDIAVINGPSGVFEDERFALGTTEVLRSVSKASFSIVGGGHISSAARITGLDRKMDHISTGGSSCIRFLSGEKLIALEVIKDYWKKKWSVSQ